MSDPTPEAEGHYWAKLCRSENPDHNSVNWEVALVIENILRPWCEADIETGECMMAMVPGIEQSYPLDAFEWGRRFPCLTASPANLMRRLAGGGSDG